MLLGVPVFTIIYSLIKTCINRSLEKGISPEKYNSPEDVTRKRSNAKEKGSR